MKRWLGLYLQEITTKAMNNKEVDTEIERVDIDKLNEAIRLIRDYCVDTECPGCLLKRKGECSLLSHLPCGWAPVTVKD